MESIKEQLKQICEKCDDTTTVESLKEQLKKIYQDDALTKMESVRDKLEKIRQECNVSHKSSSDIMKCINVTVEVSKDFSEVTFYEASSWSHATVAVTVDGEVFKEDASDVYKTMYSLCSSGKITCPHNANK